MNQLELDLAKQILLLFIRLLFIYTMYKAIYLLYWSFKVRKYKQTTGKVVENGIKEVKWLHRGRPRTSYRLLLKYEYFVDDRRYLSGSISVANQVMLKMNKQRQDKRNAEYWIKLYPVDRTVTVYYSPTNPEHAYLYRTIVDKNVGLLFSILIFLQLFFRVIMSLV